MYEHQEERIILRQLKAAFATEAKLEQFLSEMIDCQLIIRENRQYRLNFPIYTAPEVASLALAKDELPKFKGTVAEQLFWIAESFWREWGTLVLSKTNTGIVTTIYNYAGKRKDSGSNNASLF